MEHDTLAVDWVPVDRLFCSPANPPLFPAAREEPAC